MPVIQNPVAARGRLLLRDRDRRRLVDRQLGRDEATRPANVQHGVELQPVQPVADAEQAGRGHRGPHAPAVAEHTDQGELRSAAEQQQ